LSIKLTPSEREAAIGRLAQIAAELKFPNATEAQSTALLVEQQMLARKIELDNLEQQSKAS
jgi:hypothetical protein